MCYPTKLEKYILQKFLVLVQKHPFTTIFIIINCIIKIHAHKFVDRVLLKPPLKTSSKNSLRLIIMHKEALNVSITVCIIFSE